MPGQQAGAGADLVVYGATAGGVVAAIAAADAGLRVVLAEPSHHVGGMFTGGLSRTDIERQEELVGGLAQEVFARIGRHDGAEGEGASSRRSRSASCANGSTRPAWC